MILPTEQAAIRSKCLHPSGTFVEFSIEDVETSIPERFETRVQLYPDNIAIETDHEKVTYAQLNELANRLAHRLIERSLPRTRPIGLLFHKGKLQIAATLAVLKAGHFFVVIEPSLPNDRMRLILEDCSIQLMIADFPNAALATRLMAEDSALLVREGEEEGFSSQNPRIAISPDDIAYVTHTSGSFGRPKGVIDSHRASLHSIMLRTNAVGCCPSDRASNVSSGTVTSVSDAFFALLNGAAVAPFVAQQASAAELRDYIKNRRLTILQMASPQFRQLGDVLTEPDEFPELRVLRLRSDQATLSDFELYKRHFAGAVFVHGLASSETHELTYMYFDGHTRLTGDAVPVGYAVPGKELLLVNDAGQPVGYNEVGEIVVRSAYISPGYWNNSVMTAAKFKCDPEDQNRRLYFTGDLGLMLPDGCLIHKGRRDYRIKIRGYGVDLSEVENVLRGHETVRDAVVVDRKDKSGDIRLIAYFTSSAEETPTASEWRRFFGSRLADYAVPSVVVRMQSLPLGANGKLDRKALPEPGQKRPALSTPYRGARNAIEETLVRIWEEILAVAPIGVDDDFFDLGGHSLAATRVIYRVLERFNLELPLQSLFESPTIGDMATVIAAHQGQRLDEKSFTALLDELESLSDNEAKRLVGNLRGEKSKP